VVKAVLDDVCKFLNTLKLPELTSVTSIKEASLETLDHLAKAKITFLLL